MAKRFDWGEVIGFLEQRKSEGASYKMLVAELESNFGKKVTVARLSQVFKRYAQLRAIAARKAAEQQETA